MHNFAYAHNPKNWSDYHGREDIKKLCAGYVIKGASALPRSIFITGPSGCGKTSLVRLLMRSFRCLDRTPFLAEPCGKCAACLDSDERLADGTLNDVYWIQPGGFNDEDSLKTKVKQALYAASKGQRRTDRPNHDVLWVVFDEWQTFPINIRQEILIRAEVEVPGNNVCYVFITMQEDRLGEEDRVALMRRSTLIKFNKMQTPELQAFLATKFPDLNPEIAEMIASKSRGSTGLALAYYDNIKQRSPRLELATAAQILGYASNKHRWGLWEYLRARSKFKDLQAYVTSLLDIVEPLELSRQLLADILESIEAEPTEDQLYACSVLNQYQGNYKNADLLTYLIMLSGSSVVTRKGVYGEAPDKLGVTGL
jgi:hypothetical protein